MLRFFWSETSFWKLLTKINFKEKKFPGLAFTQPLCISPQIHIMLGYKSASALICLSKWFKSFANRATMSNKRLTIHLKTDYSTKVPQLRSCSQKWLFWLNCRNNCLIPPFYSIKLPLALKTYKKYSKMFRACLHSNSVSYTHMTGSYKIVHAYTWLPGLFA